MCVGRIFFGNGARLQVKKKRKKKQGQRGGPALVCKGQGESAAFFLAPSRSRTHQGKGTVPSKSNVVDI
jgi:hypothetical protein